MIVIGENDYAIVQLGSRALLVVVLLVLLLR